MFVIIIVYRRVFWDDEIGCRVCIEIFVRVLRILVIIVEYGR